MSRYNRKKPKYQQDDIYDDILVKRYTFTPKTPNQEKLATAIENNKIVITIGEAGTGKSHISVIKGILGLLSNKYKKLVLTRPCVTANEEVGFLPGPLDQKLFNFLRPLYDEISYVIDEQTLQEYIKCGIIEAAGVGFLRGRTFKQSFICADEFQNATWEQTKLLLTRIGEGSKLIINCDFTQSDLPHHKRNRLQEYLPILSKVPDIEIVHLTKEDIVREKVVKDLLEAIETYDKSH